MVENGDFSELYWDDIVKNNISKLDIRIEKISENSIYEIDNLEELDYVKSVVEK
ncbi:CTP--phosphocholine cytidylyltransferase, partial [Clostridium perfringens]|nr:CTP--phosphocholine cytidylyltransferase [Clostridium perfringens]